MLVGVPKEIKTHEYRVGLTPASVREYLQRGHKVVVETGAGNGIGASDDNYRHAGAEIVKTAAAVFKAADMIVKVKEPQLEECAELHEGQILFPKVLFISAEDQARFPETLQAQWNLPCGR